MPQIVRGHRLSCRSAAPDKILARGNEVEWLSGRVLLVPIHNE